MEDNSGLHKAIEFRTTDKFSTCDYFQDISTDDTRKHSNINGTENPNHSPKALMVCTRQNLAEDEGEAFGVHEIIGIV
jgi:hypothetical protein